MENTSSTCEMKGVHWLLYPYVNNMHVSVHVKLQIVRIIASLASLTLVPFRIKTLSDIFFCL